MTKRSGRVWLSLNFSIFLIPRSLMRNKFHSFRRMIIHIFHILGTSFAPDLQCRIEFFQPFTKGIHTQYTSQHHGRACRQSRRSLEYLGIVLNILSAIPRCCLTPKGSNLPHVPRHLPTPTPFFCEHLLPKRSKLQLDVPSRKYQPLFYNPVPIESTLNRVVHND